MACNSEINLTNCIDQGNDPRPFELEIGDRVVSTIVQDNRSFPITVLNPVYKTLENCDNIFLETFAIDPKGNILTYIMDYKSVRLYEE